MTFIENKLKYTQNLNIFITTKNSKSKVTVEGPLGILNLETPYFIQLNKEKKELILLKKITTKIEKQLINTYTALLTNMFVGVTKGYSVTLKLVGVGFKAEVVENFLVLKLGFSHEVKFKIDPRIKISIIKATTIVIFGLNKQNILNTAAQIQKIKAPEPYKGKGILFQNKIIRRKQGKVK